MKKLLSTKYSATAFNIAMLLLRFGFAGLLLPHGYDKLVNFEGNEKVMINFLGMGKTLSLVLLIFSEFFCSIFLLLGLFTRLVAIPPIISMTVALFKVHDADIFGEGKTPSLYLVAFIVILLLGPGKLSADGMMGK